MPRSFLPRTDSGMLNWSRNLAAKLSADAGAYGVSPAAAAEFVELQAGYAAAYQRARDPNTRTLPAVAAKNAALVALQAAGRRVVLAVRADPGVTDEQQVALGLTLPGRRRAAIPPPADRPTVSFVSVDGRVVRVRLGNVATTRLSKPADVSGAAVFAHVGPTPPDRSAGAGGWAFPGVYTRPLIDVPFAADVPPGSVVWLTAHWLNPRGQPGPAGSPASVHLGGGVVARAAQSTGGSED